MREQSQRKHGTLEPLSPATRQSENDSGFRATRFLRVFKWLDSGFLNMYMRLLKLPWVRRCSLRKGFQLDVTTSFSMQDNGTKDEGSYGASRRITLARVGLHLPPQT